MSEPLRHLARIAPPWVTPTGQTTECGRPLNDVAAVVSWDQAATEWKRLGRTRAAMIYCMTCVGAGTVRHQSWQKDATAITERWLSRGRYRGNGTPDRDIERTLHALGALVEAHRSEFDAMLHPDDTVADLTTRRKEKNR